MIYNFNINNLFDKNFSDNCGNRTYFTNQQYSSSNANCSQ